MKDTYENAKKMARKGGKMVIYESQILGLTLYFVMYMIKRILRPQLVQLQLYLLHCCNICGTLDGPYILSIFSVLDLELIHSSKWLLFVSTLKRLPHDLRKSILFTCLPLN